MKKLYFLIILSSLLTGCLALQDDELSSLKIKVLNLETQSKMQETKLMELEKKMDFLESKLSKELSNKFLQAQSKLLSDIEEQRKELTALQSKIEELHFQREAEGKTQRKVWEDLTTRIEALDLKIRKIEALLANETKAKEEETKKITNQTTPQTPTNATITEVKPKVEAPANQTKTFKEKEPLKEEDLYQKAFNLYEKGDLKGAMALWEEYLKLFPKGKWVGQTHFYLGEIAFKEKDYETAILEYQKLIEQPGVNPLKPKAMLKQAEAFIALKDKKAAEILYRKIIKTYPGSPEAKEAEKRLKALK